MPNHHKSSRSLMLCWVLFAVASMAATKQAGAQAVAYSFGGYPTDGDTPYTPDLVADSSGNLYGTTLEGGTSGEGTLFELF